MINWGISANSHDASIAVIENNTIKYAAHSERSSGIKNDKHLNQTIIREAKRYGTPDNIVWYENHWLKRMRQIRAGQYNTAFTKQQMI